MLTIVAEAVSATQRTDWTSAAAVLECASEIPIDFLGADK